MEGQNQHNPTTFEKYVIKLWGEGLSVGEIADRTTSDKERIQQIVADQSMDPAKERGGA